MLFHMLKFDSIIRKLFDFYANSAVHTAGLEEVQSLLQEKQIKILEPCATRWLSIEHSVYTGLRIVLCLLY